MKLYDRVKQILETNTRARNSDKVLIWEVFRETGTVFMGMISEENWLDSISTESIRRCRQKIVELYPGLQADKVVQTYRKGIERQKGTHIFRERITVYDPILGKEVSL